MVMARMACRDGGMVEPWGEQAAGGRAREWSHVEGVETGTGELVVEVEGRRRNVGRGRTWWGTTGVGWGQEETGVMDDLEGGGTTERTRATPPVDRDQPAKGGMESVEWWGDAGGG